MEVRIDYGNEFMQSCAYYACLPLQMTVQTALSAAPTDDSSNEREAGLLPGVWKSIAARC